MSKVARCDPLLPSLPFEPNQLEGVFARVFGDQAIRIEEVLSGNINTILKVEVDGRSYGLRIRTQEQVYRYEPDLMKEVFVSWLLQHDESGRADTDIATAFSQILAARCGLITNQRTVLPQAVYFDWSREYLPHPYLLYEWVTGELLWNTPEVRLYALAGQALAKIHRVQFSAFYADFPSIGKTPVNWADRYRAALEKEVAAAGPRLPSGMVDAVRKLDVSPAAALTPCLVHNDYAPANILVREGTIAAVIDWDNAVIDAPHLDFVKMKYWTVKEPSGLIQSPVLFRAFVEGYGETGRELVDSAIFALYEVLWLLRVFNFEMSKQERGIERTPGYPEAVVYVQFLEQVLRRILKTF